MNQILITDLSKKIKKTKHFIVQFVISIISILCYFIFYISYRINIKKNYEKSVQLSNNYEILKLYSTGNQTIMMNDYDILGTIIIPKLNINYAFFYGYNEELLKMLPCRFYGNMPPQKSNLCITAHNYDDNRFFGKISELDYNDLIVIEDNFANNYNYFVFDKFEVPENNLSPINYNNEDDYILTLITCNNLNSKRIIVKAKQEVL